ncbi:peptidoglycan DD-metalloendopeptidase family protein [Neptunomonas phycophila]|jgi:murein DD-endopeptidase|uniref:Peptidoglycan DD-metalloendopeptidase family protein n=1 Tax=Neptunomonas phycophila TaxID=1572645 RepID=A0AAW7XKB8_9GAMM|nr:peptidoglycan DD-metalloendopeptidase family protein [Neptunomonas phycophila]MBT3145255.1 peptidoglycan DD-metalloendopeptidase family protein [Neptunomonas phycophila]MDO6453504.1 peptidoglycan DD-metalloendopeptidase family protein [Neptunomonas phycophila]MDO6468345.1 peptidoglycan DD-metalloendopeptidase family protein [Neptunomonas phycophila]MDP2522354.1 peptidoglycan DD-metalloendopeptidase family protein [Neptunomonas phycophila]
MRQVLSYADRFWAQLPSAHKLITIILTLAVLGFIFIGGHNNSKQLELPKIAATQLENIDTHESDDWQESNNELFVPEDYYYTIGKGDTLSQIFDMLRIPQATMYEILESDLAVLALDTIKPGDNLRFWMNPDTHELSKLELEFSRAHIVTYQRAAGGFEYSETILPGVWQQEVVAGSVKGSFYQSAQKVGLNANEIMSISALFKDKMNFNKGFRRGDTFEVIRSRQTIDGYETGDSRIEAIRINSQKRELTAFLYKDSYYDKNGTGMERAFSRIPLKTKARISSNFNPTRRHPITRLIRPHNGTDFAVGVGTPVYSTGDGVVEEVVKNPYAGLYIKIKHGQKYKTRYLHLSKSLVHKGQAVTRGQKIALSGNSGRSTGAHLHYELHVNNRPVNAMGDNVPIMTEIEGNERKAFKAQVAQQMDKMSHLKLALLTSSKKN